jgi:hypothetical protein
LLGRASRLTPTSRFFRPGRGLPGSTGIDDFGGCQIVIELRRPGLRCAGRTVAVAPIGATTTGLAVLLSGLAFANLARFTGLTTFARFAIFTRRAALSGLTRLTAFTSAAIASAAVTTSLAAVACC